MAARRITEAEKDEMRRLIEGEASYAFIASRMKLHVKSVGAWARRNGYHRGRGWSNRKLPIYACLQAYNQAGMWIYQIADKVKCGRTKMGRILQSQGLKKRSRSRWTIEHLLAMKGRGLSYAEIGRRCGLHESTIKTRIHRYWRKQVREGKA